MPQEVVRTWEEGEVEIHMPQEVVRTWEEREVEGPGWLGWGERVRCGEHWAWETEGGVRDVPGLGTPGLQLAEASLACMVLGQG